MTSALFAISSCKHHIFPFESVKKNTIPSINNTQKSILLSERCSLWQNVNHSFGAAYSQLVSLLPKVFIAVH